MILLDDIPLNNWGLKVQKEHDHPAIPDLNSKTMTIPGMAGEWDFGAELGIRNFSFPLGFIEYDKVQKQRRLREFIAFLFDSKSKPREIKLSFEYEPEKYYFVKVPSGFSPQRIFGFAFFELPLTAYDPYSYAEQSYKKDGVITGISYDKGYLYPVDPNDIYLSSEIYTLVDPIPFNEPYKPNYFYENPTSIQWTYSKHYCGIYNHSHFETPFIVEINGTVTNPKITNQTLGKTINLPSITNQKMVIDSKKFTVKVNGVNKLSSYSGDFFNLESGNNSLLFEGDNPNATITFKWKHKFI